MCHWVTILSVACRLYCDVCTLATQRKRRGIIKASITRFNSCLKELESKVEEPATHDHAQRLSNRLDTLNAEFKTHQFTLINLMRYTYNVDRQAMTPTSFLPTESSETPVVSNTAFESKSNSMTCQCSQ